MNIIRRTIGLCLMTCAVGSAWAADSIKVGFLATASNGTTIGVSKEIRAGFDLAVKQLGGKLGGLPVEVIPGDDQSNPDIGKQVFDRMVKRDKIDVVTGIVSSGVIYAIAPLAAQQKVFYINSNVGPRDFVADKCSPYYFNTGWHIESANEAMGTYMKSAGLKKVFVIAAGVPVGREHIEAFKRTYGSPVVGEIYYKPQTLDFSAEIAQIRAAQPDAVYAFAFGPLAVNFVKQYAQAGLKNIPLYGPAPLADEDTIPATGESMAGVITGSHWNVDLPTDANKAFVAAFQKENNRQAALYNEQGYATAMVLDAAVRAVKGKIEDKAAFRKALETVSIEAPRGPLKFNVDHSPVQNIYLRQVVKSEKGDLVNRTQKTIVTGHAVRDASTCSM
ncbi:ABC transporter substrate-binding protein [soil metagenome]